MANVISKLILCILVLAVFLLLSPLIIGVLLDTFGTEVAAIIVVLLFALLLTVGISQRRRKKAGRSGPQTLPNGGE